MQRREFLITAGAAVAWPFAARAQQAGGRPRVGMLWANSAEAEQRIGLVPILHARLAELGWVDGRTISVEERFADGDRRRLEELAAELARLEVDLIVTGGEGTVAAAHATKDIPIVTTSIYDPVVEGFAASLAHPGGNVTGNAVLEPQILAKRLETLRRIAPSLKSAGLLAQKGVEPQVFDAISAAANTLGMEVRIFELSDPPSYEATFAAAAAAGVGGLVIADTARAYGDYGVIAPLANQYRMATAAAPIYARSGGLFGYGPNFPVLFGGAATYVDKILKGAKPGEIPMEQPTRFQAAVNLRAAAALGLEIPADILAAADEVIE
jgi:putative ABC transport system substrate-binding protein